MNALAVFDIHALMYVDDVAEFHSQVVSSDFVHMYLALLDVVRGQTDEDGIAPFLASAILQLRLAFNQRNLKIN